MLGTFKISLHGETIEVKPSLADAVAYETTARRRKWGGIEDPTSQMTVATFLIWKALTRTNKYSGTLDDFLNEDLDLLSTPNDEAEDVSTGDPT